MQDLESDGAAGPETPAPHSPSGTTPPASAGRRSVAAFRDPALDFAQRLLGALAVAAGLVLAAFSIVLLAPGEVTVGAWGQDADVVPWGRRYGLSGSVLAQLTGFFARVVTGDLGISSATGRPVAALIAERLPATLLLVVAAFALASLVGVLAGVWATVRPHAGGVRVARAGGVALLAAPAFWIGQLAVLVFAVGLGWIPTGGPSAMRAGDWAGALSLGGHVIVPALLLASPELARVARLTRARLGAELGRPYVRAARGLGLAERRVVLGYGLRSVWPHLAHALPGRAASLLAGAVLLEVVFDWPGVGPLIVDSIAARDVPVLLGVFLIFSLLVVLVRLAAGASAPPLGPDHAS